MQKTSNPLKAVLEIHAGRLVGDGVPPADVDDAVLQLSDWSEWLPFWSSLGSRYEAMGDDALDSGHKLTAGRLLWYGSMAYHYAQFLWFHDEEAKSYAQREKVRLYDRAAPLLSPPARRIEFNHQGQSVPGYLRLPNGKGPHRCVILLGGLESTKEESHLFENLCLERGVATFTFDGPGQGDFLAQAPIGPNFESYTSAAIDMLSAEEALDRERFGVLGRSLGGYYAVRSAATDDRIKACVVWGAFFDMSFFDQLSPLTRDGFVHAAGLRSSPNPGHILQNVIDLSDVAAKLTCDTFVLHGGQDHLVPHEQVVKLKAAVPATTNATWVVPPNGNHCCHNMGHLVRPAMADWLNSHL